FATMLIIGLLAYRMRSVLSLARQTEEAVQEGIDTLASVQDARAEPAYRRQTPQETARAIALLQSLAVHRPEYGDVTGPIPIYQNYGLAGFSSRHRQAPAGPTNPGQLAHRRAAADRWKASMAPTPAHEPAVSPGRHVAKGPLPHDMETALPPSGTDFPHLDQATASARSQPL